jgi:hypothetical protein
MEVSVIPCPCGRYQIEENAKICPYCGILLAKPSPTRTLEDTDFEEGVPRWGTARFNSRMNLVLSVRDHGATFVFDAGEISELVVGRRDPDSGEAPAIDLEQCGAIEKGVSRRHASIVRKDGGSLSVIDRGSPNGTFLNGQKLIPNQPRILRDGDEIRLGRLVLAVKFQRIVDVE